MVLLCMFWYVHTQTYMIMDTFSMHGNDVFKRKENVYYLGSNNVEIKTYDDYKSLFFHLSKVTCVYLKKSLKKSQNIRNNIKVDLSELLLLHIRQLFFFCLIYLSHICLLLQFRLSSCRLCFLRTFSFLS